MPGTIYLALAVVATLTAATNAGKSPFGTWPDKCLDRHTKDTPSKEEEKLVECKGYRDLSCCTAEKTRYVNENGSRIAAFAKKICGPLSKRCEKYYKATSCFYQCEPMLWHFQNPDRTNAPLRAPICGQFCDDWFEACKDDLTPVEDWITAFLRDKDSVPADGSTCITFAEMYKNGKKLCNKQYATSYKYKASNKKCMVMKFKGKNPNLHGDPYGDSSSDRSSSGN